MIIDARTCTKCNVEKPLSEFSKAPRGLYGHKASCKACDAARHAVLHPPKPRVLVSYTEGETRECKECGETKPLELFSTSSNQQGRTYYRHQCKACGSKQALAWFYANKERHKETKHRWTLKSLYGITPEEYLALLSAQGDGCAICGNGHKSKPHGRTGTPFRLAVDHCHDTGRVRGLLCDRCNRAIGLFGDNLELLRKAIEYLERE